MKVKDIVNLKGCYSAYDVGELEVNLVLCDNILCDKGKVANDRAELMDCPKCEGRGFYAKV